MRLNRSVSTRARRSPFIARLARAGSGAALALMVATCHSDNGNNPCTVISLAFTSQPTTTAAGVAINVTVTAQDASGNTLTCFGDVITMALGTNPGGGTLSGNTTATAVSGVATFTNLTLTKASAGYTLRASGGGASGASATFTINAGTASVLAFTTQPATGTAGAPIAATVTARDQFGNTATSFVGNVTMAIGTNPASGTLGGTMTVAASAGIAGFTALTINKVGTGYTLTAAPAAGAPPAGATSTAFDINPGPPNKLVFSVEPSDASAGSAIAPAIQVTAQDAQGNTTPAFNGTVTITISTNPGAGTLSGTAGMAATGGTASFPTLSINKPGTGYKLTATAGTLTAATSAAFNVAIGPLAQLVFSSPPTNATAGAVIAPAVTVTAQDAAANTVTSFTGNVTVAIGTNPGSGTLGGILTQPAAAGVATFNNLNIDKAGTGYTLTATSGGVPQVASATFSITPAAAAKLSFTVQPVNTAAGSAITPAVKVTALDQFDNVATSFTGNVSVDIGTNANSGTLSGTASLAAAAGVATFATLSIDSAGTGYTLTATAASLTDGTSSTFNIVPGTATRVVFTAQPSNATAGAGIAPAVKVTALDAKGNVVTTYTANVTVAIGTNPGSGALSGTATVAAAAGVATFTGLNINKSGIGYALTAASGALTVATSATFNIIAGAANHLVYTVQPVNTAAGAAFLPAIKVAAQDALGNVDLTYTANVSLTIGTNAGGGALTGGGPVAAAAGVATFSTTSIDKVGTGYTLNAASGALTGATSTGFNIFANTATHLIVFVQPVNTVAGVAISPSVVVQALDGTNNVATGFSGGISIAIGTNNGGGTLSGNAPVTAVAGVATFSNLSIDKVGDGYTLSATAGGVAGVISNAFKITPAAATHLVFSQQPTSAVAGAAISPAVTVSALDANDNVDTAYITNIVMAIGTNAGGGTLTGTTPVAAVHGVATFPTLSIDKSGTGYTLNATSGLIADVVSGTFNISPAALSQLVFTGQPTNAVAGATIQPDVLVAGQDAFGNTVTTFTGSVSIAIGTNPGSGALSPATPVSAQAGVATFSNLSINKAGQGYTLVASATGASDGSSNGFNITAGAATVLAFTVQPAASTTAGTAISSPIAVAAQDNLGNTVASFAGDITVAITGGTGKLGATLSGTIPIAPTNGVAVFSNLSIDSAGTGYTLTASATGLRDSTSNTFAITAGTATKLAFTINPVTTVAGQLIPTIHVNAQDALGNTDPSYAASSVGLAITGGSGKAGALLTGGAPVAASSGIAVFSSLTIDSAATGYTLTAASGSLTNAVSTSFNINAGPVSQIVFGQQPTTAQAGATVTPSVTVVAKDAIGNINTGYVGSVTLTIPVNPGSATPSNPSAPFLSGVATFSNLSLNKTGIGYRLQGSDGTFTTPQSSPFDITPAAADHLFFGQPPTNTLVNVNINPAVVIVVQDLFNNTVTGFNGNITVAKGGASPAGNLGGLLTRAAQAGVATFATLDIDQVGTGFTLTATTTGLSLITSPTFNITTPVATQLVFTAQPATSTAGSSLGTMTVEVRDSAGQVVTSPNFSVALSIKAGTGTHNATLGGTNPVTTAAGVATFGDINIDKSGSSYKLTASAATLTSADSKFFSIRPGAATQLVFTVQPSNAVAGQNIAPAVEVTAEDGLANADTSFHNNVTVTLSGGGTLSGTQIVAPVKGVASFSTLSVNNQGTYTLTASATGPADAPSNSFDITTALGNHLVFSVPPATTVAGDPISSGGLAVQVLDGSSALATGFVGSVTLSITANTGTNGASLRGTVTRPVVSGTATFNNVNINKSGNNYKLSAAATGAAGATSGNFNITAGAATQVVFTADPVTTTAGVAIPTITVTAKDSLANTDQNFSGPIRVRISVNPSSGTLSGDTILTAGSGTANFTNLSINKSGSGYRLLASSGALTSDVSGGFTISAGAATHLVFTVAPNSAVHDAAITPPIRVAAYDAFENLATSFPNSITLAIATGTLGASITGTTTLVPSLGEAIFSGLSINLLGTYTLSATATGVPPISSVPFTIIN
jgi:hypothetical protein